MSLRRVPLTFSCVCARNLELDLIESKNVNKITVEIGIGRKVVRTLCLWIIVTENTGILLLLRLAWLWLLFLLRILLLLTLWNDFRALCLVVDLHSHKINDTKWARVYIRKRMLQHCFCKSKSGNFTGKNVQKWNDWRQNYTIGLIRFRNSRWPPEKAAHSYQWNEFLIALIITTVTVAATIDMLRPVGALIRWSQFRQFHCWRFCGFCTVGTTQTRAATH